MWKSALLLAASLLGASVNAAPTSDMSTVDRRSSSSYWVANIQRQGTVPFVSSSGYAVYRNVQDFGAKGDGVTDDTAAINNAISSGSRCGEGCDSSTTSPALVYFPPGTYVVSTPIIQYYFTQLVGDAITPPTIKAASNFAGIAVIDSDPYEAGGANWYTNQNNFYRQVRNFVIDLTGLPETTGSGIHWQVAQATSLQNIVFNMIQGSGSKQQGIFMDNGSGGWMSDLVFNGGNYGAFFGNQQFTSRNMTFNNCNTAIYMNWNWAWSLKGMQINNCGIGIDMSNSPSNTTVGSVVLADSTFSNTPVGVKTAYNPAGDVPATGNTLTIDNVDFTGARTAVENTNGGTVLAGGSKVASWVQGKKYTGSSGSAVQGAQAAPSKPAGLLDSSGNVFQRSKPQYQTYPASSFVSVKSKGAKGDGVTDDTAAIQNAMNSVSSGQILYFDHGAYVISSTVKVPANIKMTGEIWPMIMAKGSAFQDQNNPAPVFQIGQPGDTGAVEMSDMVFQTIGPQIGAKLIEWNVGGSQGANGMWDVHFRIGGSAGTDLQSNTCAKNPSVTAPANAACEGAFLLLHITSSGSCYVENQWAWVADHELDLSDHNQVNIFNGRGVLIESTQPTWWYGHAAEHSVLYNYLIHNAANVYMSMIQTETPYFQTNPDATTPFTAQSSLGDPTFSSCASNDAYCKKAWGLMIEGSSNVLVYGAGLYSFFQNYDQTCLNTESCQTNMVLVSNSQNINLYNVNTKAAVNMITTDSGSQALDANNRNNFCATVAMWTE